MGRNSPPGKVGVAVAAMVIGLVLSSTVDVDEDGGREDGSSSSHAHSPSFCTHPCSDVSVDWLLCCRDAERIVCLCENDGVVVMDDGDVLMTCCCDVDGCEKDVVGATDVHMMIHVTVVTIPLIFLLDMLVYCLLWVWWAMLCVACCVVVGVLSGAQLLGLLRVTPLLTRT